MKRRSSMEERKNRHDRQPENGHLGKNKLRRRAINQLAIGSVILLWGSLLIPKQIGIIDNSVSTWPYPLATFGILLVVSGIYRLGRSRVDGS
jgi:hypothetical protein